MCKCEKDEFIFLLFEELKNLINTDLMEKTELSKKQYHTKLCSIYSRYIEIYKHLGEED